MRRSRARLWLLLLWLLPAVPAAGEVFLRRPGGGGATNSGAGERVEQLYGARQLLSEPVVYHGLPLTMNLGTVPLPLDRLLELLAGRIRRGPDSVRVDLPAEHGWQTRYLLIPGRGNSTLYFEMRVPSKLPEQPEWPRELPLPPGAVPTEVIQYPARRAWYGAFALTGDPGLLLAQLAATLAPEGWIPLSGEATQPDGQGRGELFLRAEPRALLWVDLDGSGGVVYYKDRSRR